MADQFGGVPLDEPQTDQFGGVPVGDSQNIRFDLPTAAEARGNFWRAKLAGDEKAAGEAIHALRQMGEQPGSPPRALLEQNRQAATDEMTPAQQFLGGAGGKALEMGRGFNQRFQEVTAGFSPTPYPYDAAARNASAQEETQQREMDAPLQKTGWGFTGGVGAQAAPLVAGGVLARGTSLAGAFLPRSFTGSVGQGAVIGGLQPLGEGEGVGTLAGNMGLGGLAGGGGYGVTNGLAGLARVVQGRPLPFTNAAVQNAAGRVIREAATDPANLSRNAPSRVPGVSRTLAEETLDPGIAQLQRQFPEQLSEQQAQNNAARVQAIRTEFRGADDAAIKAIESTRDAEARQALRGLRSKTSVAVLPVISGVDALIAKQRGRPAVASALQYVKDQLESGIENADQAYNVRKTIGDLMEGRLSGDLASASAAKQELMTVRYLLDRQMRAAVPQWGEYLRAYKSQSRLADQVRVGKTVLDRGASATENAATGERTLTPDRFARLTNNPDQLAKTATGFNRSTADKVMTPQQRQLVAEVNSDLSRLNTANNAGRAVGSNTKQNFGTQAAMNRVAGIAGDMLPIPGAARRVMSAGANAYGNFVNEQVAALLANPAKARAVLARLPPAERYQLELRLSQAAAVAANSVVFPALQK